MVTPNASAKPKKEVYCLRHGASSAAYGSWDNLRCLRCAHAAKAARKAAAAARRG